VLPGRLASWRNVPFGLVGRVQGVVVDLKPNGHHLRGGVQSGVFLAVIVVRSVELVWFVLHLRFGVLISTGTDAPTMSTKE
jgi:hypothetical protein